MPPPAFNSSDTHAPAACSQPASGTNAAGDHSAASDDVLPSEVLLRGQKTIAIRHNGEIYRLQATRLGKLILTK